MTVLNGAVPGGQSIGCGPVPYKLIAIGLTTLHGGWTGGHLQLVPDIEIGISQDQSVRRSSDKFHRVKRCVHGNTLRPSARPRTKAIVASRSQSRLTINLLGASLISVRVSLASGALKTALKLGFEEPSSRASTYRVDCGSAIESPRAQLGPILVTCLRARPAIFTQF